MTRGGPESLQPNPRISEIRQRLFGDKHFQDADPQMKTAMARIQSDMSIEGFIAHPTEDNALEAQVATDVLKECVDNFATEFRNYSYTRVGDNFVIDNKPQT